MQGENIVIVDFECGPVTNTFGHTAVNFPDKILGNDEKYFFGWNEFYCQRTLFPNFEQPDIRGSLKLFVCAPMTWIVNFLILILILNLIFNLKKLGDIK